MVETSKNKIKRKVDNMRKTILLGVNNNTIYTGEFEVTTRNGYKEFTASFNIGWAFDVNNIDDRAEDYFEELWNNSDDERKLEMLQDGEITKAEARDNFISDTYYYTGYRAFIDCSCTDYELDDMTSGDTINFETVACGQIDIRRETDFEKTVFTNKEAVMKLLEFWDNFHLKEITEAQEQEINSILESMSSYEPYGDKFDDFIRNNVRL